MMRLRPAVRYSFLSALHAVKIYLSVILCIYVAFAALSFFNRGSGSGRISGVEASATIFCFVAGIVSVREDLRFLMQNGCGRKTLYCTQILTGIGVTFLVALGCNVLYALFRSLAKIFVENLLIVSVLDMLKNDPAGFLPNLGFIWAICLSMPAAGMFISLVYYRLNKAGKILVSIGVPAFLLILLPVYMSIPAGAWLSEIYQGILNCIFDSELSLALSSLIAGLIFYLLSYPLLHKAPVK